MNLDVLCGDAVKMKENRILIYISKVFSDTFGLESIYCKTFAEFIDVSKRCQNIFPHGLTLGEIRLSILSNRNNISRSQGNKMFSIVSSILKPYCKDEVFHRSYRSVKNSIKKWCEERYSKLSESYVKWPEHWEMKSIERFMPRIVMYHIDLYESVQLMLANPEIMLNEDYRSRIMLRAEETLEDVGGESVRCTSHFMTGLFLCITIYDYFT
jgi:hypothetical protein